MTQSDGSEFAPPVVAVAGTTDPAAPLVVLLHGRGSDERQIMTLAGHLPEGPAYAAVRAPIAEGGGYAWFANRGIGRPVAESLAETTAWFTAWLDEVAPVGRPVVLVGFSGGAAFAGALLLQRPTGCAGVGVLHGTLPFDAGLPVTPGGLVGAHTFVAQGDQDHVIPREPAGPHVGAPHRRLRCHDPLAPRPRRPRHHPRAARRGSATGSRSAST